MSGRTSFHHLDTDDEVGCSLNTVMMCQKLQHGYFNLYGNWLGKILTSFSILLTDFQWFHTLFVVQAANMCTLLSSCNTFGRCKNGFIKEVTIWKINKSELKVIWCKLVGGHSGEGAQAVAGTILSNIEKATVRNNAFSSIFTTV